jgi:hypothetical protein
MPLFHKQQTQEDLDQNYYKRRTAYNQAKEEEREKIAKQRGIEDAHKIADKKPFYQKLIGVASAIGKDLVAASGNVNTDALFTFDNPEPERQSKRKHKRNKRNKA